MKRYILVAFIMILGMCCTSVKIPEERPTPPPTPWTCAVEIESYFRLPEDNQLTKPSTLHMQREKGTRLVVARGAGTVIHREGDMLIILTAKHVIAGARDFWVKNGISSYKGYDAVHSLVSDVSIFKVKNADLSSVMDVAPIAKDMPVVGGMLDVVGNAMGRGLKWMTPGPMASSFQIKAMGIMVWRGSYHSYPGCSGAGIWHKGKIIGVVSMVMIHRGPFGDTIPYPDMGLFVGLEQIHPLLVKPE